MASRADDVTQLRRRGDFPTLVSPFDLKEQPMPATDTRTISLPAEQAGFVDALVASGAYATASEVVRAGLQALQERDVVVGRWLHDEVVGVAAAMAADPDRAVLAETVFADIRALHLRREADEAG